MRFGKTLIPSLLLWITIASSAVANIADEVPTSFTQPWVEKHKTLEIPEPDWRKGNADPETIKARWGVLSELAGKTFQSTINGQLYYISFIWINLGLELHQLTHSVNNPNDVKLYKWRYSSGFTNTLYGSEDTSSGEKNFMGRLFSDNTFLISKKVGIYSFGSRYPKSSDLLFPYKNGFGIAKGTEGTNSNNPSEISREALNVAQIWLPVSEENISIADGSTHINMQSESNKKSYTEVPFSNQTSTSTCKVLAVKFDKEYSGDCLNSLAHGNGTAVGTMSYKGEFKNGYPDGKGIVISSQAVYQGNVVQGVMEGQGKVTFDIDTTNIKFNNLQTIPAGQSYEGSFKNGMFNGYGVYKSARGDIYEGSFINGKYNGYGSIKYIDGSSYEGKFEDNLYQGLGIYTTTGRDIYTGEFSNNTYHGKGTFKFSNGQIYKGEWVKGKSIDGSFEKLASSIYNPQVSKAQTYSEDDYSDSDDSSDSNQNSGMGFGQILGLLAQTVGSELEKNNAQFEESQRILQQSIAAQQRRQAEAESRKAEAFASAEREKQAQLAAQHASLARDIARRNEEAGLMEAARKAEMYAQAAAEEQKRIQEANKLAKARESKRAQEYEASSKRAEIANRENKISATNEKQFALNSKSNDQLPKTKTLIKYPEAIMVCTKPTAPKGKFRCSSPINIQEGRSDDISGYQTPDQMVNNNTEACPELRRLNSTTHLVWGCGFAATGANNALDRSAGVNVQGRRTYYCEAKEFSCRNTSPN